MPITPSSTGAAGTREYLTVLFKYRTAILVTFAAVVATVSVGTLFMKPTYEAEARILVKFGRENIYRSEVGSETNQVLAFNTEEILNSEVSILTSRDLITQVVSTMTVERLYPDFVKSPPRNGTPLQAAVEAFTDALTVDAVRNSSVIEIALRHEVPEVATAALDRLLEDFKEKHLLAYSDPQSSYLQKQLDTYEQRLMESQDRLGGFKQESGVFALEEQRSLLLTQRADLDAAMNAAQSRVSELRQGIAALEAQLETVAEDVPLSTENERYRSIDDARTRLLALRLSEQDLLRQYTEQNRLVVSVREEMQVVERFIGQQETDVKSRMRTGQNVVHQELQTDLFRLRAELPSQEARVGSLRAQIGRLDARIPVLDRSESVLDNLERDITINDRNYMAYQERVEEARTLEELDRLRSANISVIQAATVPARPITPRIALNLGLALLLGAMAGVGVALASELYSQALSTPESVERRLGIPVLATIVLRR